MKKLLFALLACLLVMPAMAFYEEGQKITVHVLDEYWPNYPEPSTRAIELTCGAPQVEDEYSTQYCENKEEKVILYIDNDAAKYRDAALEGGAKEEMKENRVDRNARPQQYVLIGRSCNNGNRMAIVKFQLASGNYSKHFTESFRKIVKGKGYMNLSRYYDPEDAKTDYSHFRPNAIELFDVRRTEDSDLGRFCKEEGDFKYPDGNEEAGE